MLNQSTHIYKSHGVFPYQQFYSLVLLSSLDPMLTYDPHQEEWSATKPWNLQLKVHWVQQGHMHIVWLIRLT